MSSLRQRSLVVVLPVASLILVASASFAQETPDLHHTGDNTHCNSPYDYRREAFSNSKFDLTMNDAGSGSIETASMTLTFEARYLVCDHDASSETGYRFRRVADSLGGRFEKKWRHEYVIANLLADKRDERIMTSEGFHADMKISTLVQMESEGPYTVVALQIPLKKLLDKKERALLDQTGALKKGFVVLMSDNGMAVNAGGGSRLDFTLSHASGDSAIELHR